MLILAGAGCARQQHTQPEEAWRSLFNGRDIDDWIVKINHHDVGVNYGNAFRVEDGILKVRYDDYGDFNAQFGHLYYKQPFSYYHLVVENYDPALWQEGKRLTEGYIALQSEGQPIDFRKVELLNLEGCMDPRAAPYKSYYVKPDPNDCE
jgi:hypothetical protein